MNEKQSYGPGQGLSSEFRPTSAISSVKVSATAVIRSPTPPPQPEITLSVRIDDANAIRDLFLVLHGRHNLDWSRLNAIYNTIGNQLVAAGVDLDLWLREGQVPMVRPQAPPQSPVTAKGLV